MEVELNRGRNVKSLAVKTGRRGSMIDSALPEVRSALTD